MAALASQPMPWEQPTAKLRCQAAASWLRANGRQVEQVYACDEWAVFYVSLSGEPRHQRWRPDPKDLNTLVMEGPHKAGWPVYV